MVRRTLLVAVLVLAASSCKKKKQPAANPGTGSAPVAGSNSGPAVKLAGEWIVTAVAGVCSANEHGACPPDTECTPPPTRAIECPAGLADGNARVVMLEDKTCAVAPDGCTTQGCIGAKTPCPLPKGESLPPLSWAVTALADGLCRASWLPPGGTEQSVTIKCPVADANLVIRRKSASDPTCTADHAGTSIAVPCPVEPKSFPSVAAFRDALAKDANLAKERVRVTGVFVKSLMFSKPQGKNTLFTIGAADTKGDAKTAIKCTSTQEFTEIPDGDPIVVEGTPKPSTADGVSLTECQASVP